MTNRIRQLTVILDADYRDDDVARTVDSIAMIKGVAHVTANVLTMQDQIARTTAKIDLRGEIFAKLDELLRVAP